MQSAHLPQVTEFKYLGSTLQGDGDMNAEVNVSMANAFWVKRLKRRTGGHSVDGKTGGICQVSYATSVYSQRFTR